MLPVPTSTIDMRMIGPNLFPARMRRLDLAADQDFGPLQLDYAATYSYTHLNSGQGKGADLTMRITNVGWILDRTQSDLYPRFTQTSGPDFTNFANYRIRALLYAGKPNWDLLATITPR